MQNHFCYVLLRWLLQAVDLFVRIVLAKRLTATIERRIFIASNSIAWSVCTRDLIDFLMVCCHVNTGEFRYSFQSSLLEQEGSKEMELFHGKDKLACIVKSNSSLNAALLSLAD